MNNIELIILGTTKIDGNAVVLHTLSREFGRRGFVVHVGKSAAPSLLLPLGIVEADIAGNPKSTLGNARRIVSAVPLIGIRNNLYKNTMTLFMSEVLYRTVKDGANEEGLYDWCRKSILTLDAMPSDFSNYHIRFLLELCSALGFSPTFEDLLPYVGGEDARAHLDALRTFVRSSFSESMLVPLSGADRNKIAEEILRYLEFHTESSINVRSLRVLHELFL